MQSILRGLVVVIFVISITTFGFALMIGYTNRDLSKQVADLKSQVGKATAKKAELKEARANAKESEQGLDYWVSEYGKSKNANDRRETKEYPELMQALTAQYAQDRAKFEKTEEENIKAGERTLAEKQRNLKELRIKVQQARVERDKARVDIEGLEAQKKELLNRTAQASILLEDVRRRNQEVAAQLEGAKRASGQPR